MPATKPIRILLLGATFETGNMGVSALAAGAIKCALAEYPDAEISFLDYAESPSIHTLNLTGRQVSVSNVNIRFSKKFWLPNHIGVLLGTVLLTKLLPFARFRRRLLARNSTLLQIENADLVAAISGGDSFSDIYGLTRLLYCTLPQLVILLLGRKLVLLPQTFGPYRLKLSRAIARYIVRRASHVRARDYRSLEVLKGLLKVRSLPENCAFGYDLGLVLDPVAMPPAKIPLCLKNKPKRDTVVGVNISGLLLMGGYTGHNMFALRVRYRDLVRDLIQILIENKGARVLLIPHVLGNVSESDVRACQEMFDCLHKKYQDRLDIMRSDCDQSEIKHIIGRCDFFIGSRMHACIAAISQGVPTVAVAYSDKFIGVMETLGAESLVADARRLGEQQIMDLVERSYEKLTDIRIELSNRMPEVIKSALKLFGQLREPPKNSEMLLSPESNGRAEFQYDNML